MSLVDDIKNQVKKSAGQKQKFLYFKSGTKIRVRFLDDMEDGIKVLFHDSYAQGINTPCQELFGRECKYCDDSELRHRDLYVWSVWDHEAKEVKLLMHPVNSFSPIPSLVAMYETYGTIKDRDYVIQKNGEGTSSSYSVIPMDKSKFVNRKAKPYTEAKILEFLDKGFSDPEDQDNESTSTKHKKTKKTAKPSASDYEEYSPRELYEECIARGLEAEKKKRANYYISLLEEDDMEMEAEEDEEEEELDYDSMTAKQLYQLCIDKGIDTRPKKTKETYIELLEEYDENEEDEEDENDDWEDEEDEEDEW